MFGKWLGGGLGWALGGPIGAIIGFGLGSLLDDSQVVVKRVRSGTIQDTTANDFTATLLVLSAAVMKSDGRTMRSELEFVKQFFARQFGERKAAESMLLFKDILTRDIPIQEVCIQVKQYMPYSSRLQLLHYLYGLANADGQLHPEEINVIEKIAYYLGIGPLDSNSIKAMYYRDAESDYKILEIEASVTDEEVKKAYRRVAMKFHPDRVASLGEDVQKAANEKFKKVQEAYENIKKKRGMN